MPCGPYPLAWMFYVIHSKDWKLLLTSGSFFFKTKCYWVLLNWRYWKAKHFFHLFVWLEIILLILLFHSNFFFRHCRGIHFFNLQGKRFTENKLKSSDHEFNMFRKCHTWKYQKEFWNALKEKLLWCFEETSLMYRVWCF